MDFLIVGYLDSWRIVRAGDVSNWDSKLFSLTDSLFGDGQRGDNESSAARSDKPRPFNLHERLSESAIGKDTGAALANRPLDDIALKRKEDFIDGFFGNGRTDVFDSALFFF
ncbi:MAG: hypothetical protein PHC52_14535 [Syntrophales bacterium]|nr:hypothetical protein [Syntrophales bacterium]